MIKKCSKCGLTKSLEEFYKDKKASCGYHSWCKDCTSQFKYKVVNLYEQGGAREGNFDLVTEMNLAKARICGKNKKIEIDYDEKARIYCQE